MSQKNNITVFQSLNTTSKTPISPYGDKTFVFETFQTETNLQLFSIMVSHFILNIPLGNLDKPVRTYRRKANLEKYYSEKLSYLILDIDDVKSEFDKQKILQYFKDYKVILGQSKSYNGIDNFNLKGFLFTEPIDIRDGKTALSLIHHELQDLCTIDESATRKASLNAPILKNVVFLNNEDGDLFKFIKSSALDQINLIKEEYLDICKHTSSIHQVYSELDYQNIEADSIETLCLKIFQSMGFQAIRNNSNGSITFKHPSENKTVGGYFWFSTAPYTMHHANSVKTINIFETVKKLDQAKELLRKDINYDDEFLNFNTSASVITVNEQYLKLTPEITSKIELFLNSSNGLLSIRSPMGTGKSTVINHVIQECHDLGMKVLIITNRISVANDFGLKYNMKIYNQDEYEIGDSLICQYDSIWKYNIKFFDIVIMDEFISLILHSRNNLNNSSINIAKFFGAFNKKLVIADAFLTGYENFLLSNKTKNVHLIDNIYRDCTDLYEYSDFNTFVDSVVLHSERAKLTVSSTSLSFINSLQLLLEKKGLSVVTLTADTPDSTKKIIYELFKEEKHDKWDVLIFSPTLTVGVSNLNNIPYHFHYDSSMSTDVISSIQMIKRSRKPKEVHFYIKERTNFLKTTYNDIRDEYMSNVGSNIDQNYLFDIDDYGEYKLSQIGKKAIKIDTFKNILEFNHKNALLWLLKYHFMKEPIKVDRKIRSNILLKYQKELKENKQALLLLNIKQFLSLNNIEKTSLLLDCDSDKILRSISIIDSEVIDSEECNSTIKSRILECAITDQNFLQKCKNYKLVKNYSLGLINESDIKNNISKCVMGSNTERIGFYNSLLKYNQTQILEQIHEQYHPGVIAKNKQLKFILDQCGYSITKNSEPLINGYRGYTLEQCVKNYYKFIKL